MRAKTARTESYALDLEVRWGSQVLLRSERLHGAARYALYADRVPPGVEGFAVESAWIAGDQQELASLHGDHALVQSETGIRRLSPGEQAEVALGPLLFRFALVVHERATPTRPAFALRQHAWTWASCALHALVLLCFALLPPKASSLSLESLGEDLRYARYLTTPLARELPRDAGPSGQSAEQGARAREAEGAAGKSDATRRDRRMAIRGDDRQRGLAKPSASAVQSAGLLGALQRASAELAPSSPFSAEAARGMDAEQAMGALFGDVAGESFGFNGLGLRGSGRAGGGDVEGTIGVGQLGTGLSAHGGLGAHGRFARRREGRVPSLHTGVAEVHGSLSKETIRRTIQRHLSEVRFCYEQGLGKQPELAGRVAVGFLIAPSGVVQQATLQESTLPARAVAECVVQAVRRWSFPAPEGGGYVRVVYPFSFSSAD